MWRLSYGICRCAFSYTTQVVQVRLLLRVAQCTCTVCPIYIIPSILWPGGGKCNIVGTLSIGHPVLIEEGCRELWKVFDTKNNYRVSHNKVYKVNWLCTLIYFSKKMAKIVSSQNGTKFHQIWMISTMEGFTRSEKLVKGHKGHKGYSTSQIWEKIEVS